MHPWNASRVVVLLGALVVLAASAGPARATQVWSGRTFAFAKPSGADFTLPANQDRITPLVWITRGATQGLFNIEQEGAYVHYLSPAGTTWATGDAVNHSSLTFTDWDTWVQGYGGPPYTVGVNAVVHLVADDIYIDITFDSWVAVYGGGFSYHRGVASATPTETSTWGRLKSLYR